MKYVSFVSCYLILRKLSAALKLHSCDQHTMIIVVCLVLWLYCTTTRNRLWINFRRANLCVALTLSRCQIHNGTIEIDLNST